MKMNLTKMLKNLTKWSVKHQPEILQAFGFAAGASALVLTATGTVKAVKEVEEKKPEGKVETVKATAKYYIPAAIAAGVSVGCHISASKVYIKRNAMLTSWGMMAYEKLNKLEEKNAEVLGEKKANKIKEEIAVDEIKRYSANGVKETGHGNTLFIDGITKQVFRSDYAYVQEVVNTLNNYIVNMIAAERGDRHKEGHYPSLWEYETLMGLEETDNANHYGWYDGQLLRVHIWYDKASNGEPIGYIDHKTMYGVRPEYQYIPH